MVISSSEINFHWKNVQHDVIGIELFDENVNVVDMFSETDVSSFHLLIVESFMVEVLDWI
jgi:hypothetical protein